MVVGAKTLIGAACAIAGCATSLPPPTDPAACNVRSNRRGAGVRPRTRPAPRGPLAAQMTHMQMVASYDPGFLVDLAPGESVCTALALSEGSAKVVLQLSAGGSG